MNETHLPTAGWHVFGQSVRGAAHERDNRSNQDSMLWWPATATGASIAVAVADGHGSTEYSRSKQGSTIAVHAIVEELKALVDPASADSTLSGIKRAVTERLPQTFVRRWEADVQAHLDLYPMIDDELNWIEQQVGTKRGSRIRALPKRAYGSTLLAVLMTGDFVVYVQLGDGDILIVADDGTVRNPFPRDPRFLGNEVTSLAMDEAWREINIGFQPLTDAPPALVLVSSDGYSNSFKGSADFQRVGSDVLDLLRRFGLDAVTSDVDDWLADAANIGGDDATLAVLCRLAAIGMPPIGKMDALTTRQTDSGSERAKVTDPALPSNTTEDLERAPANVSDRVSAESPITMEQSPEPTPETFDARDSTGEDGRS